MADDSVVFRGVVTAKKALPARPDLKRNGYAITFRVDEYWKGSPGRTLVIYGVDPGTDCQGGGEYQVGKSYLVFAVAHAATDVLSGNDFWYGWKDMLPEGSVMLVPDTACKPGGEIPKVKASLDQLGPGRAPSAAAKR